MPQLNTVDRAASTLTLTVPPAAYSGGTEITRYDVAYRTSAGTSTTVSIGLTLTWQLTGWEQTRSYWFKARAVNGLGEGPWSDEKLVDTATVDPPATPTSVSVSAFTTTTFDLTWSMPASCANTCNVTSYTLALAYATCTGTCPEPYSIAAQATDCISSACTTTVTSRLPNTAYTVTLQANNPGGSSPPSTPPAVATTISARPGAPTPNAVADTCADPLLGTCEVTQTSMYVSWGAAAANGEAIQNYVLEACVTPYGGPAASTNCTSHWLGDTVLAKTLHGLSPADNVTLRVAAINSIGISDYATWPTAYYTKSSPAQGIVPTVYSPALPGVPNTTVIHITWSPPFDYGVPLSGYHLSIDGSDPFTIEAPAASACAVEPQYLLVDLYPGQTHNFTIAAINGLGAGETSLALSQTTANDVPGRPEPPSLDYSVAGKTIVQMSPVPYSGDGAIATTAVGGGLVYELEEQEAQGTPLTYQYASMSCTAGLLDCTRDRNGLYSYTYRVRAVNSVGAGAWSSPVVVPSASDAFPNPPESIEVNSSATELLITWNIEYNTQSANASYIIVLTPGATTASNSSSSRRSLRDVLSAQPGALELVGASDGEGTWAGRVDTGRRLQSSSSQCLCEGSISSCCIHRATSASSCERTVINGTTYYACTFLASGIVPNTDYSVSITSQNDQGQSLSSEKQTAALPYAPDQPNPFITIAAMPTSLFFVWTVPPNRGRDIKGYVMQVTDEFYAHTYATFDANGNEVIARGSAVASCNSVSSTPSVTTSEGDPIYYTLSGLAQGIDFVVQIYACNALGTSDPACVCSSQFCPASLHSTPSCNSSGIPPHTTGRPDQPTPPTQINGNLGLQPKQPWNIFAEWELPYDNQEPIDTLAVNFSGEVTEFAPGTLAYNFTALRPAKQYRVQMKAKNARGWSDWSVLTWFTTLPYTPAAPGVLCDNDRMTHESLAFAIDTPADNGQDILEYEYQAATDSVRNFSSSTMIFTNRVTPAMRTQLISAPVAGGGMTVSCYTPSGLGLTEVACPDDPSYAGSMLPEQVVAVRARARNSIAYDDGWGPWSNTSLCSLLPVPDEGPPFMMIIIALGAAVLLILLCFWCYYNSNKLKVFAPKLRRKKKDEEPLAKFVCNDQMPMEEHDPELVMNPVLLARMQLERDNARKAKGKKGGCCVKSGGLARLGITCQVAEEKDPKKTQMHAVDNFLVKTVGVSAAGGTDREKAKDMQKKLTRDMCGKSSKIPPVAAGTVADSRNTAKSSKNPAAPASVQHSGSSAKDAVSGKKATFTEAL